MSTWRSRQPAFSNGTEFEMWQYQWCEECKWDVNAGCPLIEQLLLHEPVPEVVEKNGVVRCTEWRPR